MYIIPKNDPLPPYLAGKTEYVEQLPVHALIEGRGKQIPRVIPGKTPLQIAIFYCA